MSDKFLARYYMLLSGMLLVFFIFAAGVMGLRFYAICQQHHSRDYCEYVWNTTPGSLDESRMKP